MLGFPFEDFSGIVKVADYNPNAKVRYFHKLASIYIDISLIDSSSSSMEKDAAWDMALENMARRNSRIQILKELGYDSDLLDLIE